jgi:hypothetical protein
MRPFDQGEINVNKYGLVHVLLFYVPLHQFFSIFDHQSFLNRLPWCDEASRTDLVFLPGTNHSTYDCVHHCHICECLLSVGT